MGIKIKLKMFRTVRWAFISYLIFPIVLLFIEFAVLSWRREWLAVLLEELMCMVIFLIIVKIFIPTPFENPLFIIRDPNEREPVELREQ